jgi:hypothetical protein
MGINKGDRFIYPQSMREYEVESLCMIKTHKEGTENGWSNGVSYRSCYPGALNDSLYVRELDEFLRLFEKKPPKQ